MVLPTTHSQEAKQVPSTDAWPRNLSLLLPFTVLGSREYSDEWGMDMRF